MQDSKGICSYSINIPGRIRVRHDALEGNQVLCKKVNRDLLRIPGVIEVNANPLTSRVLVVYDPKTIKLPEIESRLLEIIHPAKKNSVHTDNVVKASFAYAKPSHHPPCAGADDTRAEPAGRPGRRPRVLLGDQPRASQAYALAVEAVVSRFQTHGLKGITVEEARARLKRYGKNALAQIKQASLLSMFVHQFDGFIIKLLLAASGISLFMGQYVDSAAILIIILVEAAIGIWQERKAQKSLDSLKELSAPAALVIRDGRKMEVPAEEVVVGDLLQLEAGDVVPADARIVESHGLQVIESALTGEAFPVFKKNVVISQGNVPLGDRINMVYMGTSIVKGNARAIVVATGTDTEMGRISCSLGERQNEKTPLQKDIDRLAKFITMGCVGICAAITLIGILFGNPPFPPASVWPWAPSRKGWPQYWPYPWPLAPKGWPRRTPSSRRCHP